MTIRSSRLGAVIVMLTAAVFAAPICAQVAPSPDASAHAAGTAAITGVVVEAGTNTPIPDALVSIAPGAARANVLTDAKGRFIFLDLPASSSYLLSASKAGYFSGHYGGSDTPNGKPIALGDGQWFADARIELTPSSAITGTVVDERGDPVVGAYVRVLTTILVSGRSHLAAGPATQTDDRGMYRLGRLQAGRYLVSVPSVQSAVPAGTSDDDVLELTPQAISAYKMSGRPLPDPLPSLDVDGSTRLVLTGYVPPLVADGRAEIYPTTFYPGAQTVADALAIDLGLGEERQAVDIQLHPVPAWRVSGVAQGSAGSAAGLTLRLLAAGSEELGFGSETATTVVGPDGRFEFVDVPAGSYTIDAKRAVFQYQVGEGFMTDSVALPRPPALPASEGGAGTLANGPMNAMFSFNAASGDQQVWGREHVDVPDHDLTGVVVTMHPTVTISGQFVWNTSNPGAAESRRQHATIFVEPADGDASLGMQVNRNLNGATFTISGLLPGRYVLTPLGGGAVKSIVWNDKDYTDTPFDTSEGHDFTGVVITLTDERTSLAGTVEGLGAGTDATVIAFPVDPDRWSGYGFQPRRLQSTLVTNTGTYRLSIPAGDYYVVAIAGSRLAAWQDPAFLAAAARVASRVSLDWGDIKNLDLHVSEITVGSR